MKLKYYLRGLGIGIVVTLFVMMAALGNKQPMTDEEVIARAKELGMIENSVLTDIAGKKDEAAKDETAEDETKKDDSTEDETKKDESTADETINSDSDTDKTNDDEAEETPEQDKTEDVKKAVVSITVVSGDSSWTVSKRMEEAGLIESAKDFDTHLCRYGYDKKISVGTYEIPTNATHEEMAKILTKAD